MKALPKDGLRIAYTIQTQQREDGSYVAFLGDPPSPLAGIGPTPLEAVRGLCETIRQWPLGGAQQWLEGTPEGAAMKARFCQ